MQTKLEQGLRDREEEIARLKQEAEQLSRENDAQRRLIETLAPHISDKLEDHTLVLLLRAREMEKQMEQRLRDCDEAIARLKQQVEQLRCENDQLGRETEGLALSSAPLVSDKEEEEEEVEHDVML